MRCREHERQGDAREVHPRSRSARARKGGCRDEQLIRLDRLHRVRSQAVRLTNEREISGGVGDRFGRRLCRTAGHAGADRGRVVQAACKCNPRLQKCKRGEKNECTQTSVVHRTAGGVSGAALKLRQVVRRRVPSRPKQEQLKRGSRSAARSGPEPFGASACNSRRSALRRSYTHCGAQQNESACAREE
jgi:hypothetical protein